MDNEQQGRATADVAESYIRRQAVWSALRNLFREERPTDQQLGQVSTLAEVAIDQVFAAYKLTEEQQIERHGTVKDYAECASLYGYVMGYHQGLTAARGQ